MVSWFQSCTDLPNVDFMFFKDIDRMSKISKLSLDGSAFVSSPAFSETVKKWIAKLWRCIKQIENAPGFFLDVLSILVSQNINNIGLGPRDTSKNPEIIEMRSFGFSHKQIEKL